MKISGFQASGIQIKFYFCRCRRILGDRSVVLCHRSSRVVLQFRRHRRLVSWRQASTDRKYCRGGLNQHQLQQPHQHLLQHQLQHLKQHHSYSYKIKSLKNHFPTIHLTWNLNSWLQFYQCILTTRLNLIVKISSVVCRLYSHLIGM